MAKRPTILPHSPARSRLGAMRVGKKRGPRQHLGPSQIEAVGSETLRKELKLLGIKSFKLSDRFNAGIPDIYVAGGNWIESKVIPLPASSKRIIHPRRFFSGPQRTEMHQLSEQGDTCFVAVWWQHNDAVAFTFMPWWEFLRVYEWDLLTIAHFGIFMKPGEPLRMDRFFNKEHPNKFDPGIWWNAVFDSFVDKYPKRFVHDVIVRRPDYYLSNTDLTLNGVEDGKDPA